MQTSLSIDEILLSMYVNLSTNFRDLPRKVEKAPFPLKRMNLDFFICVHMLPLATGYAAGI